MRTSALFLILVLSAAFVPAEDAVTPAATAPGATAEPVTSWPLAITWKAHPIHPLKPAASLEQGYPDTGISPEAKAAVATGFDDSAWSSHQLPGNWEGYGPEWNIDGEVVYRLSVDLPAAVAGKDLELSLGAIDDFDDTYVNGEFVGRVDKNVIGFWTIQRVYRVPGKLVVAGRNVIAVRIFDHFGGGGFSGPKEKLLLRVAEPVKEPPKDPPK